MHKLPALLAALACLPLSAQVVINEVSASNLNGITDSFGDREDWVELYNTTGAAVDLSGWYVSNKVSNPTKWPFPAGASIPASGKLIVYCSKRNTVVGTEYHTSFKLNQRDDDHVVLSDPSATIIDDVTLDPPTMGDNSRGTNDGRRHHMVTVPEPHPERTQRGCITRICCEAATFTRCGVLRRSHGGIDVHDRP